MCGTPVPSWTKSPATGSGDREADAAGTGASAGGAGASAGGKREGAGSPSGRRASSPAGGRTENANRMMVSMECPHCGEFIWAELAKGAKRFVCPYCHKLVDLKDEGASEGRATREGVGSSATGAGAAGASAGAVGAGTAGAASAGAAGTGAAAAGGVGAEGRSGAAAASGGVAASGDGTTVIPADGVGPWGPGPSKTGTVVITPPPRTDADARGASGGGPGRTGSGPSISGAGTGAGYGTGSGAANGSGAGYAAGTGYGTGTGTGSGYAAGTGAGYGTGAGAANGTGAGYASGAGYGTATGAGYGGSAGGYVSASGPGVAGQGAAGPVTYIPPAPPRRGRGKVVAAVVGGVAVVAVAAVLVLGGGLGAITGAGPSGGGEAQVTYASNEEVPVASGTAIVPLDDRDEPFASYTVRVKQADDADGRAIDIADMPNLDVQGTEGFTLGDLGALDAGTYRLVIEDGASGASYDLPPLVLGGASQGGGEASRVTVRPPQDTSDPDELVAQGKYACFRDKLQGLVDTYGDASITVMKLDEQRFLAWAAGVAYAELVDFGDGAERLVVAYCTERDFASAEDVQARDDGEYGPRASDYTVEVWEYDEASDELSMMCRTTAAAGASDAPVVEYVENSDTGSTCLYVGGSDVNGSAGRSCFGLDDGGAFGELQAADTATWSVTGRFLLEHSGTSQQSATDDAGSGESSCTATAQTVKDLSAHLKTVAGVE